MIHDATERNERLVALFVLGVLLLLPPLSVIF